VSPALDPVAALRDIHVPDPVPFWPPALGWWLLAAVAVALLAYGTLALARYRRSFAPPARRELHRIARAYAGDGDARAAVQALSVLLRRCALAAGTRERAGLTGHAWLRTLDEMGRTDEFAGGVGRCLSSAPYQREPEVDVARLLGLAERFIDRADKGRR
jgi:hypothetical protein